ncbi:sushi, von Willebrand factor type A, EGF and pentraxin domain-containing protein 1-like [Saccostrea echinata]|uniref:sushi, von Willebrand factor type A, EGF and pentraxin domain-containing protein 1-like n=1 Tax=Saccostrea echinata TaxID=191078 RepID=UPI002A81FC59|nr:sushi, von Willebrand factor type A, EGF and pentraxin domain-containing protein 1-like [Saccostrea echinata]
MQVLKGCFIYVFLLSTLANGSLKHAYESLQWGKRFVGRLLTNIVQVSPLDCAEECLVRSGCLSFNYRRAALFCELNYENGTSSDTRLTNEDGWIFGRRDSWPMEITEECQNKRCQINEKCILKALHIADCEIAHCHPSNLTLPKNVKNFSSDIALDFGSKHKLSCSDGYNQTGDGIVKCLRNGTWSDVNIRCNDLSASLHKCHLQNLSLPENVKNFTSDIAADLGTRYNLSCVDGYNQIGDGRVECLRNGSWSDLNITCEKTLQRCFYKYQKNTTVKTYSDSQVC